MDAFAVPVLTCDIRSPAATTCVLLIITVATAGCEGRSLNVDNPVLGELPPRQSLVNSATVDDTPGIQDTTIPKIQQTAFRDESTVLTGNTVVAEINGRPLFVDDLVGSIRLAVEADKSLGSDLRNQILGKEIQNRLEQRIDEEIALQALEAKIPEEQRNAIQGHLESGFQQYLDGLKADQNIQSDKQLNQRLAEHGMSVTLLRESFFRIQMVNGYVQSLVEGQVTGPPDRRELLQYYHEHVDEFTPEERIRWQEIRVSFPNQGGRAQAEKTMIEVVNAIQAGDIEFSELAKKYSDSLSAENGGNMGWVQRGALTDKELEEAMFSLPDGGLTKVLVRDSYFIVCRVARHEYAQARPFNEIQTEVAKVIVQKRQAAAKTKVIDELRQTAIIRTIFDHDR